MLSYDDIQTTIRSANRLYDQIQDPMLVSAAHELAKAVDSDTEDIELAGQALYAYNYITTGLEAFGALYGVKL